MRDEANNNSNNNTYQKDNTKTVNRNEDSDIIDSNDKRTLKTEPNS